MNTGRFRKRSSGENSSFTIQQGALMAALFLVMALTLQATQPAWWTATHGPLNSNPADDLAAANQGQLKQFTQKAMLYLDANPAVGAGTNLESIVAGWSNYYATNHYSSTNPAPADLRLVNEGQLRYIGNLIWSQLVAGGYTYQVPSWLQQNTNTDTTIANLGQMKQVFAFDLTDSDSNGLYDWWEMKYFGHLGNDPLSSPDGNGNILQDDYTAGADPTNYYSQIDWTSGRAYLITPAIDIAGGDGQITTPGQYTAQGLMISVTDSSNSAPLYNAPVTFSVVSGGGQISLNYGGSGSSSLPVTTDSSGQAQVYYQTGTNFGVTSTITASAAGHSVSFSETTSSGTGVNDAPSGISVTAPSPIELDLSWSNHSSNATAIVIQQSTDYGTTWTNIATLTDPTATNYAATGLTPGLFYRFRISGSY